MSKKNQPGAEPFPAQTATFGIKRLLPGDITMGVGRGLKRVGGYGLPKAPPATRIRAKYESRRCDLRQRIRREPLFAV